MQSIDHKGLYVKCENVGHLGAIDYSHIYLGSPDFKGELYVCLKSYLLVV